MSVSFAYLPSMCACLSLVSCSGFSLHLSLHFLFFFVSLFLSIHSRSLLLLLSSRPYSLPFSKKSPFCLTRNDHVLHTPCERSPCQPLTYAHAILYRSTHAFCRSCSARAKHMRAMPNTAAATTSNTLTPAVITTETATASLLAYPAIALAARKLEVLVCVVKVFKSC